MSYKTMLDRKELEVELDEYLASKLRDAGYGGMILEKTPLSYKLTIFALRPGLVIGHRGTGIRALTDELAKKYHLENLALSVSEVTVPELNPRIMASRIVQMVERGIPFRRAANNALNTIMEKGALGCEITVAGKLRTERSHTEKFRAGVVPKSGYPAEAAVREAKVNVTLKLGTYGIKVRIVDSTRLRPPVIFKEQPSTSAAAPQSQVGGGAS
ncbi:30S ribosomal protein S3 [Conexivisphaera calida]|nr:30S ribosomal protein S3 [Conexivisphaera calida]